MQEDYIASLRGRGLTVYLFGKLVPSILEHAMIVPSINAVAATYELARASSFPGFLWADVRSQVGH